MADSFESWKGQTCEKNGVTWIAERSWTVHGAADEFEALQAPPKANSGSSPISQIGESHPRNKYLVCVDLIADRTSPNFHLVRARYEIPEPGSLPQTAEPLLRPVEIAPDWVSDTEEFDVDAGQPTEYAVLNSAGFPPDPLPVREVADIGFTISRYEPVYPILKALQFRMTVNKFRYSIPGVGVVDAGQALARPIRSDPYSVDAEYVRVHYTLWIREKGWKARTIDRGYMGWASVNGAIQSGRFCNTSADVIDQALLLDGTGRPIDDSVRVLIGDTPQTPVAHRKQFPESYIERSQSGAVFINQPRYAARDFTNLLKAA
jgi:hypothetical protein